MARTVEIETLHLRLPGLSRDEAQSVARKVSDQVSKRLPRGRKAQRIDAINLRVNLSAGLSQDELSKLIARAILEKLV